MLGKTGWRLSFGVLIVGLLLAACVPPAAPPSEPIAPTVAPPPATALAPTAMPVEPADTPAAAGPESQRRAVISEPVNQVEYQPVEAEAWLAAATGSELRVTGAARTGPEARVRLDLSEGTIMRLAGESEFRLQALSPDPADPITRLVLAAGRLWVQVTKALGNGAFEVETPAGAATVRGSLLGVAYFPAARRWVVTCLEGDCRATPAGGAEIVVPPGQQLTVADAGAPQLGPIAAEEVDAWRTFMPEAAPAVAALPTQVIVAVAPGVGPNAAFTATPGPSPTAGPTRTPGAASGPNLAFFAGTWSGAVSAAGGFSASVTVTLPGQCVIGGNCGSFVYSGGSTCTGDFVLTGYDATTLVLAAVNKQNCSAAARYFLVAETGGTVAFNNEQGTSGRLSR